MKLKEMRRRLRLGAAQALPGLIRIVPESVGRGFCMGIGRAGHALVERDRILARANLSRVYPEWSDDRVRREARRVFEEIGRNAYDFLRYPALGTTARDRLVCLEGREHLETARREGRGAILVSAHLGCWEVLAAELARRYPFRALAQPLREGRLDEALLKHRRKMGVDTISSAGLPIAALRHLRRGGFLGVLADQRTKRGGVTVEFLGQRTTMTDGPARLALASGASLVPLSIRRLPDHTHRITVSAPLPVEAAGRDATAVTQRIAHALESRILAAPEQWIWIHPRWDDDARAAKGEATCASR